MSQHSPQSPILRFYCTDCASAYAQPGNCPNHADEPLLDLADEQVRLMLEDQDGSAKMRHAAILVGVVAAVTFASAVVVMFVVGELDIEVNFVKVLLVLGAGFYLAAFAMFKFKPKAPDLTPQQVSHLESLRDA